MSDLIDAHVRPPEHQRTDYDHGKKQGRVHDDVVGGGLAGSDAGIPNQPFGSYPADVGVLASQHGLGLTARQALMAATSGAAAILGLTDTGVLAPGRRADLLAVAGDPLADIDDLTQTRYVMVGGTPIPLRPMASAA